MCYTPEVQNLRKQLFLVRRLANVSHVSFYQLIWLQQEARDLEQRIYDLQFNHNASHQ